jgi:hypothetical protein
MGPGVDEGGVEGDVSRGTFTCGAAEVLGIFGVDGGIELGVDLNA